MKRVFHRLKRFSLYFGAAASVYLIAAIALSLLTVPAQDGNCEKTDSIYLQHSIVHADIAIPVAGMSTELRNSYELPIETDFVVFGLGDKDIYVNTPTWGDLKLRYALQALFLPSSQVIHVEPAAEKSLDWVEVQLCAEQRRALEAYILDDFKITDTGRTQILEGLTYTGQDRFYEAGGLYSLFKTCNNWANGAMKAAGQKTSVWSPFSQGVVFHAKRQTSTVNPEP